MNLEKNIAQLTESARRQREIAQEALDEAKEIDALLRDVKDRKIRERLEKRKTGVLKLRASLSPTRQAHRHLFNQPLN